MNINIKRAICNSFSPFVLFLLLSVFSYVMGYEIIKWISITITCGIAMRWFFAVFIRKYSELPYFSDCLIHVSGIIFAIAWVVYIQFFRGNFAIDMDSSVGRAFESLFIVLFGGVGFIVYVLALIFSDYASEIKSDMIYFKKALDRMNEEKR